MNGHLASTEQHLIRDLQSTARGPKRNGLFALWLFVRTCDGMLPPKNLSPKAQRRRLDGLKQRLSSLSMVAPLKRALSGGLRELEAGTADAACLVLRQLVAPVDDVLGPATAEVILSAAREAKEMSARHTAEVS